MMKTMQGRFARALLILAGLAWAGLTGCAATDKTGCDRQCAEEAGARPAAFQDQDANEPEPIEPGAWLPAGFRPLRGYDDPANPDNFYGEWPRYIVCEEDGMIMAYVPTQTIVMGGGLDADEVPARTVEVSHFYMDIHEVTNAQFRQCIGSGDYNKYYVPGYNDADPVRNVSWYEAAGYARWAGKELPTEAQWEAAARSDDQRLFPWGNDQESEITQYLCNCKSDRANFDGYEFAAPAMNFAYGVSPFGIFNMAGNVWEWCADNYDPGRYAYPSPQDPATGLQRGPKPFGDRAYPNVHKVTLDSRIGPMIGVKKVVRGGSFADPIERCRTDARAGIRPGGTQHNVGFRTILVLQPE